MSYNTLLLAKEINSLFAVGKVFQNGVQILRYDGEDDLCTDQLCPLAKCSKC